MVAVLSNGKLLRLSFLCILADFLSAFWPVTNNHPKSRGLCATNNAVSGITVRHGLEDRFGRWRYLQRYLDDEEDIDSASLLVATVTRRALDMNDEDNDEHLSLTVERKSIIQSLFPTTDTSTPSIEGKIDQLEQLLPEQYEDEDAFKSLWDTVEQIHGVESVKLDLQDPTWCERCIVTRVLLHFDFLTAGLSTTIDA